MMRKNILVTSLLLLLLVASLTNCQVTVYPTPSYETPQYWTNSARQDLNRARGIFKNIRHGPAKNVVLFLGDALGLETTIAARIYKGQTLRNRSGDEEILSYEQFAHIGLAKTYSANLQTTDSAATATAILSGVKTNSGVCGVNQLVVRGNCLTLHPSRYLVSWLQHAQRAGKAVGLVTTSRITHASVASAYAHSVDRNWEADSDIPDGTRKVCRDIASQLVENAIHWNVLFGGGRLKFVPNNQSVVDYSNDNATTPGVRSDGVDLIAKWRQRQQQLGRSFAYIDNRSGFDNLNPLGTDYVLGLFANSHMRYQLQNERNSAYKEPSLSEMVAKAISILRREPKGFVLYVEAARIDHGHHDSYAKFALHDTLELDRAVTSATSMTSEQDTLTIVTGDHSFAFTVGGWGERGTDILGKVGFSYENMTNSLGEAVADDGQPYTVINYADGPNAPNGTARRNLTGVDTTGDSFQHPAMYRYTYGSHGAQDVPVYAQGPSAHLLHTTHEQSYIGHVVMYATCLGPDAATWCASNDVVNPSPASAVTAVGTARAVSVAAAAVAALVAWL